MSNKYTILVQAVLSKTDITTQLSKLQKDLDKTGESTINVGVNTGDASKEMKSIALGADAVESNIRKWNDQLRKISSSNFTLFNTKEVQDVNREIRSLMDEFEFNEEAQTSSTVSNINKEMTHLRDTFSSLGNESKNAMSGISNAMSEGVLSSKEISQNLLNWRDSLRKLEVSKPDIFNSSKIQQLNGEIKSMMSEFESDPLKQSSNTVTDINNKIKHLRSEFQILNAEINNTNKETSAVGLNIDGTSLQDGRDAIEAMSKEMANVRESFLGLGENLQVKSMFDPNTEKLKGYKVTFDQIVEGVKKTETYMVKIGKHGEQILTNGQGFEKAVSITQKKIKDTSLSTEEIQRNLLKWTDSFRELESRSPKIFDKKEIVGIRDELSAMITEFADPSFVQTPEKVKAINDQMAHLKSSMRAASTETQNLVHDSDNFGNIIEKNTKKVFEWMLATTAIYGTLKEFKKAIQYIKDLNKEMVNIQVVTGGTKEEMMGLAKEFNEVAIAMGATTIEVSQSALEFIRQGKSAEESGMLVRNSMMMSKLANMESAESSEALTSIMNGYKMTVEETTSAVDKMVAVDNASASSVAELADALSRTSNIAQMAGVSFDDLVSYVGTVSSVTRKEGSSIGESFKTIFTRMQNIKLGNIDEAGESINDVEKALARVNIELRDSPTTFRDMSDVLEDVASKWSTFDDVTQSSIAQALAGTRQYENLVVLLNNWTMAERLKTEELNSAGLATERYNIYLEGLEATTNRFTASWEQLWMKTMNSKTIEIVLNLGTAFMNLGSSIGGLIPILELFGVALIALKFEAIVTNIGNITNSLTGLGAGLKALFTGIQASAAATATSMAVATGGLLLLAAAVVTIGIALANSDSKLKKYQTSLDELNSSISSLDSEINSSKGSISAIKEMGKEFDELDNNLQRNADEQERWLELQRELKTLVPEINGYYSDTGDFLFDEGTNLEKLNELMIERIRLLNEEREINRAERIATETELLEEQEKALEREIKKYNNLKKWFGFEAGVDQKLTSDPAQLAKQEEYRNQRLQEQSDIVEKAQLEVLKLKNSLGLLTIEEKNLVKAAEEAIPSLDDEVASLLELSAAANTATDSMRSAMDVSVSLLKSYEERDALTSSQIDQLRNAFPESYMDALKIEGNLIMLNVEALKEMVITRARDSLAASKAALSNIQAQRMEALSAISTAKAVFEGNNAIKNSLDDTGFAYHKAGLEAVNSANNQIAAQQAILDGTEAQYKSLQDDVKLNEIYLSQLEDGSYWANEMADAVGGSSDSLTESQDAYNDLLAITIKMIKQQKNDEKDALKDQLDGYKKIIDAKKRIIDLNESERDYKNELADKNKDLADIDAELLQLQFDNSEEAKAKRLVLEDEKAKKIGDINELQNDRSVEIQKDALDEEYDDYEELIDKKIALIDDYLKKEGLIAQEAIAMMKNRTDGFYQSLLSWNRMYGDGIDSTISKLWAQVDAANAASNIQIPTATASSEPEKKPYIAPPKTQQDYYRDFQSGGLIWVEKGTGSRITDFEYNKLEKYHDGGLVGGSGNKIGEVFAKLMKNEVVVSEPQMQNFLANTLPNIAMNSSTPNVTMEFHIAGNMDKTVLPEMKAMVFDALKEVTMNRGIKRGAKSFSI